MGSSSTIATHFSLKKELPQGVLCFVLLCCVALFVISCTAQVLYLSV